MTDRDDDAPHPYDFFPWLHRHHYEWTVPALRDPPDDPLDPDWESWMRLAERKRRLVARWTVLRIEYHALAYGRFPEGLRRVYADTLDELDLEPVPALRWAVEGFEGDPE